MLNNFLKQKKCYSVIGLGFGDEGKGKTIHSLTSNLKQPDNAIVVRHSGGQQAGHTVYKDEKTHHVFSNFGSGSFNGISTYWSKYCTIDPSAILEEQKVLNSKGVFPRLFIDKRCPVTTIYDMLANKFLTEYTFNGTVGVGVGATFQREEDNLSLLAGDLLFPYIVEMKLKLIKQYYMEKFDHIRTKFILRNNDLFLKDCANLLAQFTIVDDMPSYYDEYYFESSQGLLLDQSIGFFPHVTRSNTGTKNIVEMGFEPELFLVTRAYQTRHGNGPMTNRNLNFEIKDNKYETNKQHEFQGEFKTSMLDVSMLKYAVNRDEYISSAYNEKKTLVITCMDMLPKLSFSKGNEICNFSNNIDFAAALCEELGCHKMLISDKPWC